MTSLNERLKARSLDRSDSHPANKTGLIDTGTLGGRIRYAFGTIIMAKMPDGVKDTKIAKGMRMLWPHMSKDLSEVPTEHLTRAAMFIDLILQMCLEGAPEGVTFEDHLEQVMTGKVRVLPGTARILEDAPASETA